MSLNQALVERREWLLSQLSPINWVNKHLKEKAKRHKGTGSWLTKTAEFTDWVTRTRSDCLWCYGIRMSACQPLMFKTMLNYADITRL